MNTPERKGLAALFFVFGFAIVALVPRFPEIKANLQLDIGQFGTLLSLGAIGSVVSLLTTGHLVQRFGAHKILLVSTTLLFGALSIIVHVTVIWQFLLANIAFSAGISAFHIAVNSQAFHEQGDSGKILIPRLHGFWSSGALSTVIISGFMAGRVPLSVHIDTLAAFGYITVLILLRRFKDSFIPGVSKSETGSSLRPIFSAFSINWIVVLGLTGATGLEFAMGDWITLFSTQELHMGIGISTFPYILFVLAMITGRLSVHRLALHVDLDKLVRFFPIAGGITFMAAINVGVAVHHGHPLIGFGIATFGTFVAGLGLSFLAPTFFDAANRLSDIAGGIVLGQLTLLNTFLILILRSIIAWTAQLTSISTALMIPSVMLIAVSLTAATIKKAHA